MLNLYLLQRKILMWSMYYIFDSRSNWFLSGMETLILGGVCATVAFTVGSFVNGLLDEDE